MTFLIDGIYRDGVFHPTEPVELPDNTRVSMAVNAVNPIVAADDESEADRERRVVHEILVAAGLVRPGPVPGPVKSPLSRERHEEIAQELAKAGSVYDIIREERDSN